MVIKIKLMVSNFASILSLFSNNYYLPFHLDFLVVMVCV
jgi:hypothetical protein